MPSRPPQAGATAYPLSEATTRVVLVSTALYRRYRPETFADVIGQEHVTEPLMQALRSGRASHAYLFSGPRGCGKTTSARILARCLNCEQGPTDTPCGTCESCVALARGGAGSVDVIEIDAASHGGVDDARDLREKASYGPARSRYKVYIIDEAHMVTPQGFNALLKIVEEPPEHVKFVFATTEPDKVIGTIRSRTHHYPFRLVPPARLTDYLQELCDTEGVQVAQGVLSFVVRAGGGSVRDSLSVLDQLMAGAGDEGLTYERAAALLGFTEVELLDATVDALAAADGAAVFRQIDKVIESGQDPRRFLEDLLERLRDLIIVLATDQGAAAVLRGVPEDQLERMRSQAAGFGAGALSRAADVVNTGLTEMTGATSPRLQLELICARLLLPGAAGEQGYAARIDRLERRMELGGGHPASAEPGADSRGVSDSRQGGLSGAEAARAAARRPADSSAPAAAAAASPSRAQSSSQAQGQPHSQPQAPAVPAPSSPSSSSAPSPTVSSSPSPVAEQGEERREQVAADASRVSDEPPPAQPTPGDVPRSGGVSAEEREALQQEQVRETRPAAAHPQSAPQTHGGVDADMLRRAWPDVLATVFKEKRVTWTMLSEHAQIMEFDGRRVVLGINNPGVAQRFATSKVHAEVVRQALIDVIGVDAQVEGVPLASHASGGGGGHGAPRQQAPRPATAEPSAPPDHAGSGPAAPAHGGGRSQGGSPAHDDAPSPEMREAMGMGGAPSRGDDSSGGWAAGSPAPDWATPSPSAAESDPATGPSSASPPAAAAPGSRAPGGGETGDSRGPGQAGDSRGSGQTSDRPARPSAAGEPRDEDEPVDPESVPVDEASLSPYQRAMRRAAAQEGRQGQGRQVKRVSDEDVSTDDESVDGGAAGPAVIASILGGKVIEERTP